MITAAMTLSLAAFELGQPGEALIRTPLKELAAQLDPTQFAQVHRAVVVDLRAIRHITRRPNETAHIHLKDRNEVLPVSRSYLHHFRQMWGGEWYGRSVAARLWLVERLLSARSGRSTLLLGCPLAVFSGRAGYWCARWRTFEALI
ncbi:MAG: LytTR family DNA-binding domain-containing protein [Xanthomonadaceae bacterium]|nr:LytTR family DNA-binding domain-containing protein [Xanthomonadaceae bacterium]